MRHVIRYTGKELPNIQDLIEKRVLRYRPGLLLEKIGPEEFSRILKDITRGSQVAHPDDGLFNEEKFNFQDERSASNIYEITRVMQNAFLTNAYTIYQVANAVAYLSPNQGPAGIAGAAIGAILYDKFKLGLGGTSTKVLLELDLATRKITSIEPRSPRQPAENGKQLISAHIVSQPGVVEYQGCKIPGFFQFYADQFPMLMIGESGKMLEDSRIEAAFTMVVKVFMPLVASAVPSLEEVIIAINDFNDSELQGIITSIKNNLPSASIEHIKSIPFDPWIYPSEALGDFFPTPVGRAKLPGPKILTLWSNNNYNPYLTKLTNDEIQEADQTLTQDIRQLGIAKLEKLTSIQRQINTSPLKTRRQALSKLAIERPPGSEVPPEQDILVWMLQSKGFSDYMPMQLLNLCIAIGEIKFNYFRTLVREVRDLFASINCKLSKYDESTPLYTITPRGDSNSFNYCYKCNFTEIILNSRTINHETYGMPPNAPLLNISIEAVYPLTTGEPIRIIALELTSYVFALNPFIQKVLNLIEMGKLQEKCREKLQAHQKAEEEMARATLVAKRAMGEPFESPEGVSFFSLSPGIAVGGQLLASPPPQGAAASSLMTVGTISWPGDMSPSKRNRVDAAHSTRPPTTTCDPSPGISSPFGQILLPSPPVGAAQVQAPISQSQVSRRNPRQGLQFNSREPNS